jgi:RND family efflux transporter MFP subunit
MDFVDNVIDKASGTIRGRAVFSNTEEMFTPGMFARVRVPGSPPYEGLLVPDIAIGTEQARRYVVVVDDQDTARIKYVTLGQLTSDNLRVIKEGIGPDDRVVVNGLMQARPGTKVHPEEQGTKPASPAQAGGPPQQSK